MSPHYFAARFLIALEVRHDCVQCLLGLERILQGLSPKGLDDLNLPLQICSLLLVSQETPNLLASRNATVEDEGKYLQLLISGLREGVQIVGIEQLLFAFGVVVEERGVLLKEHLVEQKQENVFQIHR